MHLSLKVGLAQGYSSSPQQARVLSENWVANHLFCPNCGAPHLSPFENNRKAADFECLACRDQFEVKSGVRFGRQIVDGAYHSLIERLQSADNPNLVLLRFDIHKQAVRSLDIVPRHFFVPEIIRKRTPLSDAARRAGWIGCNILLGSLPQAGRVAVVQDGVVIPKEDVVRNWAATRFLRSREADVSKGWLIATMRIIERFGADEFSLTNVYKMEAELQRLYPNNRNIRAKLRQQLQRLRDFGSVQFLGSGRYRRI